MAQSNEVGNLFKEAEIYDFKEWKNIYSD